MSSLNRFDGDPLFQIKGEFVPVEPTWTTNPTASGYYFCDEIWVELYGPFEMLEEAENALQKYCESLRN